MNDLGTEDKIKEAARQFFSKKDFDGTKMRDIAELAGINTALTNYYFWSKENLFWIVFDDLLKQSLDQLNELFNSQLPLREKIPLMIQQHYEFHSKNPQRFAQKSGLLDVVSHSVFFRQLEEGIRQNQIRPILAAHLLGLMFAHCQQLYAGKFLHMVLFKTDEADFEDYARVQVGIVIDMILCYLFIND